MNIYICRRVSYACIIFGLVVKSIVSYIADVMFSKVLEYEDHL